MGGSPGPVILHVLTAVLRGLIWNRGPGHCCQEPSCCCDDLSSPLKGPLFIYLCDLKWPRTVRWGVAPNLHSALGTWTQGWSRLFPLCWHPLMPQRGGPCRQTQGPPSRTVSSHPQMSQPLHRYSVLPLAGACFHLQRGGQSPVVPNGPRPTVRSWSAAESPNPAFHGQRHPGMVTG